MRTKSVNGPITEQFTRLQYTDTTWPKIHQSEVIHQGKLIRNTETPIAQLAAHSNVKWDSLWCSGAVGVGILWDAFERVQDMEIVMRWPREAKADWGRRRLGATSLPRCHRRRWWRQCSTIPKNRKELQQLNHKKKQKRQRILKSYKQWVSTVQNNSWRENRSHFKGLLRRNLK